MRKKLLLYFSIFLLKENKLSDDFNFLHELGKNITYGYAIFGVGILIGRGVEYIEREVIVTDRILNILKERLHSEEYWKREQKILEENKKDIGEIITRKEDLRQTVERMEKIKAERKRKKEEEEAQKKQRRENNATNHSSSENKGAFPFFLTKNIIQSQSCDALYSQKAWKYSCSPFLSQSNSVTYPIESIIKSTFMQYNVCNKIDSNREKTSLDDKQASFFEYSWYA